MFSKYLRKKINKEIDINYKDYVKKAGNDPLFTAFKNQLDKTQISFGNLLKLSFKTDPLFDLFLEYVEEFKSEKFDYYNNLIG